MTNKTKNSLNLKDDDKVIQQDEYSLSRPTFPTPRGGTLTVIGWRGKIRRSKRYVVKCDLCSQDPELFTGGTFSSLRADLSKGQVPCGCSLIPKWTELQYRVKVSREASVRGLKFIGWASEYCSNKTKLLLSCPTHGEWNTTSISNFLRGHGCPSCRVDKTRESRLKEDSLHIEAFIASGAFLEGTKFWRSERKNSKGHAKHWNYICPLCSDDEYVKAGLCSGVFESSVSNLKIGKLTCRCAKTYRWSQEQREYQIKKEIERRKDNNLADYTFVGWVTQYKNYRSKFKYLCKEHGEQTIIVASFLSGCGCPECSGKTQRQAYINVVTDGNIPVALKLGIANSSPVRLKYQNHMNLFQMQNIGVWEFPTVKACKSAERECKKTLQCGVLSSRELKDGWTETADIHDLDKIIRIYEKNGGVKL